MVGHLPVGLGKLSWRSAGARLTQDGGRESVDSKARQQLPLAVFRSRKTDMESHVARGKRELQRECLPKRRNNMFVSQRGLSGRQSKLAPRRENRCSDILECPS